MTQNIAKKIETSLRALATDLNKVSNKNKFSDTWGYQGLTLDVTDLRFMADSIAFKIESVEWVQNEEASQLFEDLLPKIEAARSLYVPQIWSEPRTSEFLLTFLSSIDLQIGTQVESTQLANSLSLSAAIHKKIKAAKLRLESSNNNINDIDEKIRIINRAYDAAEQLPETQDDITQALKEIATAKQLADDLIDLARKSVLEAERQQKQLVLATTQAQATLDKLEDAYRGATSQGLAKSFTDKAASLSKSMFTWVLVLLAALFVAGIVGHTRFPEILQAVTGNPDWAIVIINVVLGGLSLAPAIWLAWVATKQIGQRFRLSEDYAYKATLSAAYEGYRSEAARLDPLFEARLFSTALGRLDELPLRLVEPQVHGSPWHEFLSSVEFKQAADTMPALKERLLTILRPSIKPEPTVVDVTPVKPEL